MADYTTTLIGEAPPPPPPEAKVSPGGKITYPTRHDPKEKLIAKELRDRYLEWRGADAEFLRNADFQQEFLAGKVWVDHITGKDRGQQLIDRGRSAFNIDLVGPSIDLVVNQVRINKMTAKFIPIGEGADKATAEIRQGLYRNIERVSKAQIARETAYQMAVSVGRGYWRVTIEDEDGPTFAQRIGVQRVDNLHSVAIDPTCLDFDYADAGWAYCHEYLWVEQFRELYQSDYNPDIDMTGAELPEENKLIWFPKDKVRVGEYFRRCWKNRLVWQLQDKTECWSDEAPPEYQSKQLLPLREKMKADSYIEWRKMTGTQTLEKRLWPGKFIPLIVCVGKEVFRGQRPKIHAGMVGPAMHPAQVNNFMFSRMVDEVALSPLPHMKAPQGALSLEQKRIVNEINLHPWSVVEYTAAQDASGRALPAPEWSSPSPNIAAVVTAAVAAKDSLQRVLTTFAPQLGQIQGDQSGKAIREVKDQGDVAHAAFPDNFRRALNQEALVVNELMDSTYSEEQAITITRPDDQTKRVLINQWHQDEATGKPRRYLFGAGKYSVAVDLDRPYPTRMAEAADKILDLAKAFPQQIAQALDLVVEDLGIPRADKYKERLRPAQFKEDDDEVSVGELNQQIQQQAQALEQADGLIEQLMNKVSELGSQESIKRLEIASRERIAAQGNITQLLKQDMSDDAKASHGILMERLKAIVASLMQQTEDTGEGVAPPQQTIAPPAPEAPAEIPMSENPLQPEVPQAGLLPPG